MAHAEITIAIRIDAGRVFEYFDDRYDVFVLKRAAIETVVASVASSSMSLPILS